jgi:hypothetical protein
MTALSDYLESGLLHHIFRGQPFSKPDGVSIALCSGVPSESDTGETIPELPSEIDGVSTGYTRYNLGKPDDATGGTASGDHYWNYDLNDHNAGSGLIKNRNTLLFDTAIVDWGWVSGIAVCDSGQVGSGNMLMYAQLNNPRVIYQGDSVKFDSSTLQITFK